MSKADRLKMLVDLNDDVSVKKKDVGIDCESSVVEVRMTEEQAQSLNLPWNTVRLC